VARYLPLRTRASLRRCVVNAMPAPMTMSASVALKLPGATQLMQVPMMAGASNGPVHPRAEGEGKIARERDLSRYRPPTGAAFAVGASSRGRGS